jgi:DNA primase catalytic core
LAEKAGYTLSYKGKKDNKESEKIKRLLELNQFVSDYYHQKLLHGANPGMVYARKRKISDELISRFKIGYASEEQHVLTNILIERGYTKQELVEFGISSDKNGRLIDKFRNRLVFTIHDERGKVVGFSGRYIGPELKDIKPPRYLNSPETLVFKKSKLLFGLYQGLEDIRKLNFVILSEGQMNIITSHRTGIGNIVASLGTSFTPDHLKLLKRYAETIYLSFDKDNAGKKALVKTLEMMFQNDTSIKIISWDKKLGKDPDELASVDIRYWIEAVNGAMDPIEYLCAEFEERFKRDDIDKVNTFLKLVLKLISSIKNEVKKEFYTKYLSEKFGFSLNSLRSLPNNNSQILKPVEPQKKINDDKKIQVTKPSIYDHMFGLILQNWSSIKHLVLGLDREYLPENYQELYDCLSLLTDVEDVYELRDALEGDLQTCFDDLLLLNIIIDDAVSPEEHVAKLIPATKMEFKKLLIKRWKEDPDNQILLDQVQKILHEKDK